MIFIFIGLAIRLLLITSAFSFDINNHLSWSQDLTNRGFSGFYETTSKEVYSSLYPNYPPLILDLFYGAYQLKKPITDIFWWINTHIPFFPSKTMYFLEKREFPLILMKLPGIFFDFLLAYIVYLFAEKIRPTNKNNYLFICLFVVFNPIFIYLSSLWGQVESINLFFILLSVYLLLYSSQQVFSMIAFALSLLVKPTGLIFLPVYLVYFLKKFRFKKFFLSFFICNLVFILIYLPFYKSGNFLLFPYASFWEKVVNGLALAYNSNSAFNFWSIIPNLGGVKDQTLFLNLVSYRLISVAAVAFLYTWILFRTKKFYHSAFLAGFAFIMFSTRMHERYFVYLLPFLFFVTLKDRRFLALLIVMSIVVGLNVYYAWSFPYADWVDGLKNQATISILSITNLILFIRSGWLILRRRELPSSTKIHQDLD